MRNHINKTPVGAWLGVLVLLISAAASPALPKANAAAVRTPGLSLLPPSGEPGAVVQVEGKYFPPATKGQLVLQPGATVLTTFSTQRAGAFAATFVVPAVAPGAYTVVATVADSSAQQPLQVTAGAVTPPPTATSLPPTATLPPPPSATAAPTTATLVPPTSTANPTATVPAPTATRVAPTNTTVPTTTATATAKATPTDSAPPAGSTFYVDSVAGNDANSGTSETAAWQSLAKANATPLGPGAQLLFKRGGNWRGSLEITASGTSTDPLVVGAYGGGPLPVITGGSSCVVLAGSFILLQDLQVDDCAWAGVDVAGSANRIEHTLVTRNAAGISVRSGAANTRILSNELRDNSKMSVLTLGGDDDSGAFAILLHGDGTEVGYNTITGSDAFSYDYGRDGSAVEVYGATGSYIHHNLAVDNQSFAELGDARSADNTFAYNVVRSSLDGSLFLVTRGGGSNFGPVLRTKVYNNTVLLTGGSSQGFVCHAGCGPDILTMRNNIIQAVAKVGYADAPFDEDYNLYSGGQVQFTMGTHSTVADPLFVNPAAGDFHLSNSSPAIDAGIGVGYTADFDGALVPIDGNSDGLAAPDIGAFEFSG